MLRRGTAEWTLDQWLTTLSTLPHSYIPSSNDEVLVLSTYIADEKLDALGNVASMLLREIPKVELNGI